MIMTVASLFLQLTSWLLLGQAPGDAPVRLQLRLRESAGAPVVGTVVQIQRMPDGLPALSDCQSNAQGLCTWQVSPGLYQVSFDRPLDPVTAAAVAEGGLTGLGLTVGQEDITYHFVFSPDSHVYFDSAPAATVPVPIIPTWDELHSDVLPVTTDSHSEPGAKTPRPTATLYPDDAVAPDKEDAHASWRLLLFIGLGVALGSGLYYRSRRHTLTTNLYQDADHA